MTKRSLLFVVCTAPLLLSACTTSHKASLNEAQRTLDETRMALVDLQDSLGRAQDALRASTDPKRRTETRETIATAREGLRKVQQALGEQPESAAKTAAGTALTAIDTALDRVAEALGTTTAGMPATLDQAQDALNDAQRALTAALETEGLTAATRLLLQRAQGTLSTAQVLVIPQLRSELAAAREPPPTASERALSEALTGLTRAQAATAKARTDYEDAQAALEKLNSDFQATAAARRQVMTARAAAQTRLAAAETAFVTARAAERTAAKALAQAAAAALTAAATEEQRLAARTAAATAQGAETALLPWAATRIAGDAGLARAPAVLSDVPEAPAVSVDERSPFTVRVSLTPREAATGCTRNMPCPNPNGLDIETDARPYAVGKTVLSPSGDSDGEEFALRAISMRGDVRHSYEGTVGDSGSNRPKVPVVQRATSIDGTAVTGSGITAYQRHYQNPMTSSIRFTRDGMVFRTGGQGTVMSLFKHDLDRSSSRGRDGVGGQGSWGTGTPVSDDCSGAYPAYCYDFNRSDAELSFGAPYADPDGEPNYYWASRYGLAGNQPQPDPEDSDGRRLANHGALGDLRVWVSNYGGLDAGALADASDDADRYLSYAAYGLFVFTDYIDEYPRPGFLQGWHFGYDAFQDEDDMKTTDVSTSIAAKFEGRTMGMILHPRSNSVASETAPHVGHFTRLRGDVKLNACIGGGACTGTGIPTGGNRISGSIDNLQALENGVWQKYAFLRHAAANHGTHANIAIRLVEGDIAADGSYSGTADSWQAGQWNQGEYSGALYGPRDKLETAGWWRLETDSAYQNRHLVAFGSFGACQAEHCRVAAPSN